MQTLNAQSREDPRTASARQRDEASPRDEVEEVFALIPTDPTAQLVPSRTGSALHTMGGRSLEVTKLGRPNVNPSDHPIWKASWYFQNVARILLTSVLKMFMSVG